MGSILPPIAGVTGPDPVGQRSRARAGERLLAFSDQRSQRCAFAILRKRFAPILHSRNDFPAIGSSGRLAGALHGQPSGLEIQVQVGLEVSPGSSGFVARCFVCGNRYGLVNLMVLASGVLCCRRCWQSRRFVVVASRTGTATVVG